MARSIERSVYETGWFVLSCSPQLTLRSIGKVRRMLLKTRICLFAVFILFAAVQPLQGQSDPMQPDARPYAPLEGGQIDFESASEREVGSCRGSSE